MIIASYLLAAALGLKQTPGTNYEAETKQWRKEQEADLTRTNGWLSLAGLYWLHEGSNTIGSDPANEIVLPASAPAKYGTIRFTQGHVTLSHFQATAGVAMPMIVQSLDPDASGRTVKTTIGNVSFVIIKRGARTGVRIWDADSKALKDFTGCKWFPISKKLIVIADFVPYPASKTIPITNVLGDTSPSPTPGYVTFKIGNTICKLDAQTEGDTLFFDFTDATTGKTTYPAGRFLNTPLPKDGKVVLDFNHAVNPPCAFTPYATCPLPPAGNHLTVPIAAGEKTHHPSE